MVFASIQESALVERARLMWADPPHLLEFGMNMQTNVLKSPRELVAKLCASILTSDRVRILKYGGAALACRFRW